MPRLSEMSGVLLQFFGGLFPKYDHGIPDFTAKYQFMVEALSAGVSRDEVEAFAKVLMNEAWQGIEPFPMLDDEGFIRVGRETLRYYFGCGADFRKDDFLEEAKEALLTSGDIAKLMHAVWPEAAA